MTIRYRKRFVFYLLTLGFTALFFFAQGGIYRFLQTSSIRYFDADLTSLALGRIQALAGAGGNVVFMGSSQTERLLPTQDVVVMGLYGSPFSMAWEKFFPQGHYDEGALLLLEANHMLNHDNSALLKDVNDWSFRIMAGSAHFSMAAKPSSMLLSYIAYKFLGIKEAQDAKDVFVLSIASKIESATLPTLDETSLAIAQKRISSIKEMQNQGYNPCLVFLPTRYQEADDLKHEEKALSAARYVAMITQVPLLNYLKAPYIDQLQFTDSHHLKSIHPINTKFRNTIINDAKKALKWEIDSNKK